MVAPNDNLLKSYHVPSAEFSKEKSRKLHETRYSSRYCRTYFLSQGSSPRPSPSGFYFHIVFLLCHLLSVILVGCVRDVSKSHWPDCQSCWALYVTTYIPISQYLSDYILCSLVVSWIMLRQNFGIILQFQQLLDSGLSSWTRRMEIFNQAASTLLRSISCAPERPFTRHGHRLWFLLGRFVAWLWSRCLMWNEIFLIMMGVNFEFNNYSR